MAAPAASVVVAVTARAPLSVMAPVVVTSKVPETVEAASIRALASTRVTLLPLVMATVAKSLVATSRVMSLAAPAASVVVPETVEAALSVTAPVVLRLKVAAVTPATPATVPRSTASASVTVTV